MNNIDPPTKIQILNDVFDLFDKIKNLSMACSQIRSKYNIQISNEVFRSWVYRFKNSNCKNHGNRIFTIQEEEEILGFLEAWSLLNRGLTRRIFLKYVTMLRPDVPTWDPKNWFDGFLKNYSQKLNLRTIKGLKNDRIQDDLVDHVKYFLSWLQTEIFDRENQDFVFVNADETRISINGEQNKMKRIESTKKAKKGALDMVRDKSATYIPFHTPQGMIMSVFLIAVNSVKSGDLVIKKAGTTTRSTYPVYYMFNDNGWMNGNAWNAILQVFFEEIKNKFGTSKIILFLDRLSSHVTDENLKQFLGTNINMVFFPANTTHFLQPCDSDIFTNFKKQIYLKLSDNLIFKRPDQRSLGIEMLSIAQEMEAYITPAVIASSWDKTGLFPFNPSKILENANLNIGKDSEVGDSKFESRMKNITTKMINDHYGQCSSKRIRATPPANVLFSAQDIINMKNATSTKSIAINEINIMSDVDEELIEVAPKKRKKSKISDFSCFCTSHFGDKEMLEGDEILCDTCSKYVFCNACYEEEVEEFIQHESQCSKKKSKKNKNDDLI